MCAKLGPEFRVFQAEMHRGFQIAELAAAIEALAIESKAEDRFVLQQPCDGVGQLDLPSGARLGLLEQIEDTWSQDVPADHGQVGRRIRRPRLLDDAPKAMQAALLPLTIDDSVLPGLIGRHLFYAEHATAVVVENTGHLAEAGLVRINEVVREMHEERLFADDRSRAQHRVA